MLTWLQRILGVEAPPPPRLTQLRNRMDELEERLEYFGGELKRLRGRVTNYQRKEGPEEPSEDALQATNDGGEGSQGLPHRARLNTAHLARRFRIGG